MRPRAYKDRLRRAEYRKLSRKISLKCLRDILLVLTGLVLVGSSLLLFVNKAEGERVVKENLTTKKYSPKPYYPNTRPLTDEERETFKALSTPEETVDIDLTK